MGYVEGCCVGLRDGATLGLTLGTFVGTVGAFVGESDGGGVGAMHSCANGRHVARRLPTKA